MIATIILYVQCAVWAWIPGTNNTNYEFFQSGIMTDATVKETTLVCQDDVTVDFYVDNPMWVVGLDDKGRRSENSNVVVSRWEWDFDVDNNDMVDFGDFGAFAQAFGTSDPLFDVNGDGIVDMGDFGFFTQAFGTCNDGKRKVECDF